MLLFSLILPRLALNSSSTVGSLPTYNKINNWSVPLLPSHEWPRQETTNDGELTGHGDSRLSTYCINSSIPSEEEAVHGKAHAPRDGPNRRAVVPVPASVVPLILLTCRLALSAKHHQPISIPKEAAVSPTGLLERLSWRPFRNPLRSQPPHIPSKTMQAIVGSEGPRTEAAGWGGLVGVL